MPKCLVCGKTIKKGTIGPECSEVAEKQLSLTDSKKEEILEDNYAYARKSKVQNQGEDVPLARRHLYHMYKDVQDIPEEEKDRYLTFKNLNKNEAPKMIKTNGLDSYRAREIVDQFPKNVDSYIKKNRLDTSHMTVCKKKVGDKIKYKQVYAYQAKQIAEVESEGFVCTKANQLTKDEFRQMYLDDYRSMKEFLDNNDSIDVEKMKKFCSESSGIYSFYRLKGRSVYLPSVTNLERSVKSDIWNTLYDLDSKHSLSNSELFDLWNSNKDSAVNHLYGQLNDLIKEAEDNDKSLKWVIEQKAGFKRTKAEIEKGKESYDFYIYQKRVGGKEFSDINEAQDYLNSVGFRGIQFGNTVSDSQREAALFRLAEAVSDFKSVIDVEDFTFNKKLAIAFGARGKSRAIAHYEPALDVINITKKGLSGGALAHEWAHAFDKKTKNIRDEFLNLESVREMRKRMHSVGKEQPNDDYWNSDEEMFARIFEKYVDRKMKKAKRNNSFLVGGINHELWPTNEEMDKALDEIDGLLKFKK